MHEEKRLSSPIRVDVLLVFTYGNWLYLTLLYAVSRCFYVYGDNFSLLFKAEGVRGEIACDSSVIRPHTHLGFFFVCGPQGWFINLIFVIFQTYLLALFFTSHCQHTLQPNFPRVNKRKYARETEHRTDKSISHVRSAVRMNNESQWNSPS